MAFLKVDQGKVWVNGRQIGLGGYCWHSAGTVAFSQDGESIKMSFSPKDGSVPVVWPLNECGHFELIDGQLVHSPFEEIMEAFGKPFSLLEDFQGDLSFPGRVDKVDNDKRIINGTGCLAIVSRNDKGHIHRLLKLKDCLPAKLCELLLKVCFDFHRSDFVAVDATVIDYVQAYWDREKADEWIAKTFVADPWNRPHLDPVVEIHLPREARDPSPAVYVLSSHDPKFQDALKRHPSLLMVHILCKRWGREHVLGDRLSGRQKRFIQAEQSKSVVDAARYLIDYYGLQSARSQFSPHHLFKESSAAISVIFPPCTPSFVPMDVLNGRYRDLAALRTAYGESLDRTVERLLPETSLLVQKCYPRFSRFVDRHGLLYGESFDGKYSELLGSKEDLFRLDPDLLRSAPMLGGIIRPFEIPVKLYGFLEGGLSTYMTSEEKEVPTIWVRKPPPGERGYVLAIFGYWEGVGLAPDHVLSLAVDRSDNGNEIRVRAEQPLHWQWDFVEFCHRGVVWRSRDIVCA